MHYAPESHKSGCTDPRIKGSYVTYGDKTWRVGRVNTDYVEIYRANGTRQIVEVDEVTPVNGGEREW